MKRSPKAFKELIFQDDDWKDKLDKETGEIIYKEKVIEQELKVKIPLINQKEVQVQKQKRSATKYTNLSIPIKIHLTWSSKRAMKDRLDRERIVERLKKRLDNPYQLKASIKRGCNQYLQMSVDMKNYTLDEAKIKEAQRYDGYYAVVTNNLDLSTEKVYSIYKGLWKIEESFRVLKTDLSACPVFVWNDEHIKGHFMMCFISLCLIRYIQYLLETEIKERPSAERIMEAICDPIALVQGDYPYNIITPTQVSQIYIDLARILKLPPLKTNMTLTQFRSSTEPDLSINLK